MDSIDGQSIEAHNDAVVNKGFNDWHIEFDDDL